MRVGRWVLPSWFAKPLEANFSCFAKIRWMPSWFAKLLELLLLLVGVLLSLPFYYLITPSLLYVYSILWFCVWIKGTGRWFVKLLVMDFKNARDSPYPPTQPKTFREYIYWHIYQQDTYLTSAKRFYDLLYKYWYNITIFFHRAWYIHGNRLVSVTAAAITSTSVAWGLWKVWKLDLGGGVSEIVYQHIFQFSNMCPLTWPPFSTTSYLQPI
jgi:hypothetical protein